MAKIGPNSHVTFDYTLRDDDGDVIDASHLEGGESVEYVHGYAMIPPGLEGALAGLSAGDSKDVRLTPEEGFGEFDDELVFEVERAEFPEPDNINVGDELMAESDDPEEPDVALRVVSVDGDSVVVDANHPLAGRTLNYSVQIRAVRQATMDEIAEAAADFEAAADEVAPEEKNPLAPDVGLFGLVREKPKGKSN